VGSAVQLEEAIFGRRSVRSFESWAVEQEKINKIIEAAIHAPSASNKQAWKFIVVDDMAIKAEICKMNGSVVSVGSDIISNAPNGILVLYRNDVSKNYKMYRDTIQSASGAIENMLLMAHSLGLGACWLCKLPVQKKMRKLFSIPSTYDIISYVVVGYPKASFDEHTIRHFKGDKSSAEKRIRKYTVEEVTSYNRFESKKECQEVYKHVNLVCMLQEMQLSLKRGKNGLMYNILKSLLLMLGEKWA